MPERFGSASDTPVAAARFGAPDDTPVSNVKPSQVGQFLGTLGSDILGLPGNIARTVRHPIDTALAQSVAEQEAAKKSFQSGEYLDALTHGIGGYAPVPFLAPFLSSTLADLGSHENLGRGAARFAEIGAGGLGPEVVRGMKVPTLGPVSRFVGEHVLGVPHLSKAGKLLDLLNGGSEPGAPAPAPLGLGNSPGPYFNERSTIDPGMHGPIPPVEPVNPSPFHFSGGTSVRTPTAPPSVPVTPGLIDPRMGPGNIGGVEEFLKRRTLPNLPTDASAPISIPHYNKFSQSGGPFKVMRGKAELGSYDSLADAQKAINDSNFVNGALRVNKVSTPAIEGVTSPKVIDISQSPALPAETPSAAPTQVPPVTGHAFGFDWGPPPAHLSELPQGYKDLFLQQQHAGQIEAPGHAMAADAAHAEHLAREQGITKSAWTAASLAQKNAWLRESNLARVKAGKIHPKIAKTTGEPILPKWNTSDQSTRSLARIRELLPDEVPPVQ